MTRHGEVLCDVLDRHDRKPLRGAEIGVRRGDTSELLLRRFDTLHLLMVDSWTPATIDSSYRRSGDPCARLSLEQQLANKHEAMTRTSVAALRREILHAPSVEAAVRIADRSLDFVFIDAEHTYESVRLDLAAWLNKIAPGGILSGHDYDAPQEKRGLWGVRQAVDEFCSNLGREVNCEARTVWWLVIP